MAATNLVEKLQAIGDAIRAKTGKTALMTMDEMPTEIASIPSGGGSFDASQISWRTASTRFDINLSTIDLTGFDTSRCTSLIGMFYQCGWLTSIDLSPLNTSRVTNMAHMFYQCVRLTSIDLSPLNTSRVTNMYNMFSGCSSLATIKTGSGWTQASITSDGNKATFPVAMQDENSTQYASGAVIPDGAHTYTAV